MKKKKSTGKIFEEEIEEFEKKTPDAARARKGKAKKAKVRAAKREILKTAREVKRTKNQGKGSAVPGNLSFPGESSSARRQIQYTSPSVKRVPPASGRRVNFVDTGVRPVEKAPTSWKTGKNVDRSCMKGEGIDSSSKVAPRGTKKPEKQGENKKQHHSTSEEHRKNETTNKKPRITNNASGIDESKKHQKKPKNSAYDINIGETEQNILSERASVEQIDNSLYPNRVPIQGLNRTLKRLMRNGRLIRIDAKPPSEKLIRSICNMIRLGNYPEVAARAFGIQNNVFRSWVLKGFEDINRGENTPYTKFVLSVDMADAQSEALDISQINSGIDNWQSKAWIRERKSFQRWGIRALQLSGDINASLNPIKTEEPELISPELGAEILTALESAGIVAQSGMEHFSGIADESPIPSRDTTSDDNESESAMMPE